MTFEIEREIVTKKIRQTMEELGAKVTLRIPDSAYRIDVLQRPGRPEIHTVSFARCSADQWSHVDHQFNVAIIECELIINAGTLKLFMESSFDDGPQLAYRLPVDTTPEGEEPWLDQWVDSAVMFIAAQYESVIHWLNRMPPFLTIVK